MKVLCFILAVTAGGRSHWAATASNSINQPSPPPPPPSLPETHKSQTQQFQQQHQPEQDLRTSSIPQPPRPLQSTRVVHQERRIPPPRPPRAVVRTDPKRREPQKLQQQPPPPSQPYLEDQAQSQPPPPRDDGRQTSPPPPPHEQDVQKWKEEERGMILPSQDSVTKGTSTRGQIDTPPEQQRPRPYPIIKPAKSLEMRDDIEGQEGTDSSIDAWTRQKERELAQRQGSSSSSSSSSLSHSNRPRQEQEGPTRILPQQQYEQRKQQQQQQQQQQQPPRIVQDPPPKESQQEWIVNRQTQENTTRRAGPPQQGFYPQQRGTPPRLPPVARGQQPPIHAIGPSRHPPPPPQQQQQQQYQQQQYQQQQPYNPHPGRHPGQIPPPQHHALVSRQPQQPPSRRGGIGPLRSSLFQKFANSIDSFADVDTLVSQKAQALKQKVGVRSGTLASQVSGIVRKSVFDASGVTTGVRDGIKDVAREGINRIFGGAPTGSGETQDEWEEDRRKTATERRRNLILGNQEDGDELGGDGGYDGGGPRVDPFQAQLKSLLTDYPTEDTNILDAENEDLDNFGHDNGGPQYDNSSRDVEVEMGQQDETAVSGSPYGRGYYEDGGNSDSSDEQEYLQETPEANAVETIDPSSFFRDPKSTFEAAQSDERRDQHIRKKKPPSYDDYDDSSFPSKIRGAFESIMPRVPSLSFSNKFRRSSSMYESSGWSDDEESMSVPKRVKNATVRRITGSGTVKESSSLLQSTITDLISNQKSTNILSQKEMRQCRVLGKRKAFFDIVELVFGSIFLHEFMKPMVRLLVIQDWFIPQTFPEMKSILQNTVMAALPSVIEDSWAIYVLIAAFLSRFTKKLIFDPKETSIVSHASNRIKLNISFSQLYLRLVSGSPIDQVLSKSLCAASTKEVSAIIANSRLRAFIFMAIAIISASTLSILQPVVLTIISALLQLVSLETLREWPVPWKEVGVNVRGIIRPLRTVLQELIGEEIGRISKNPLAVASPIVLLAILVSFTILPLFESNHARKESLQSQGQVRSRDIVDYATFANLGVSSANRIGLQMHNGSVENILNRFQSLSARKRASVSVPTSSRQNSLRKIILYTFSNLLSAIPLLVHFVVSSGITSMSIVELNWKKIDWVIICCMAVLMVRTRGLASEAVKASSALVHDLPSIVSFKNALTSTFDEVNAGKINPQADLQLTATASSTEGLVVSNLWAAHVSKR